MVWRRERERQRQRHREWKILPERFVSSPLLLHTANRQKLSPGCFFMCFLGRWFLTLFTAWREQLRIGPIPQQLHDTMTLTVNDTLLYFKGRLKNAVVERAAAKRVSTAKKDDRSAKQWKFNKYQMLAETENIPVPIHAEGWIWFNLSQSFRPPCLRLQHGIVGGNSTPVFCFVFLTLSSWLIYHKLWK